MELNIESSVDHHEKITIRLTNGDEPAIAILISRLGGLKSIHLTPFEAQTVANALLQMASKLDAPEPAKEDKSLRLETIADAIYDEPIPGKSYQAYEKTLNERIELIYDFKGHSKIYKKLMMQNGLEVLVTKEVWERESHLQLESDNASPSFINIKLDKNADWWLVDTLPF